MLQTLDIPIAHVTEAGSVARVIEALQALHGPAYDFAVGQWDNPTRLEPREGKVIYRFVIQADEAGIVLAEGDPVRGPAPHGPYRFEEPGGMWARVTTPHLESLWPGDVITVESDATEAPILNGRAIYFEVAAEQTGYRAPRLVMLRHLPDRPGGCAAYPGAFRREALPPERPGPGVEDRRGLNRVNEHTLDMRFDRTPPPIRHYHGPVACGSNQCANHSETAIILPRVVYGLPEVNNSSENGHIVVHRRPAEDPTDIVIVPVRPGSIVVTPAAAGQVMGHRFENAFAMLVAIPGFVAPSNRIE
jgi:hypothetical protein